VALLVLFEVSGEQSGQKWFLRLAKSVFLFLLCIIVIYLTFPWELQRKDGYSQSRVAI
jgi:hypothetical protein